MDVVIWTPAADQTLYQEFWPAWFARLEPGLAEAGVRARPLPWTDPLDGSADAILPMLAWGYHVAPARWLARLGEVEAAGQRLINPAPLLRWNTDKAYLAELQAAGAPVVPSLILDRLTPPDIETARRRFGCDIVVAKPRISGGSHQTLRLAPGDPLDGAPDGGAILQPFLPAVGEEGELSLFYFDGDFSHAVTKVPVPGDFRVQQQFGGVSHRVDPWPGALEAAARVLAAVPPLTYARIDLIRCLDGSLGLMELEIIEPDLFLADAPEAGVRFGAAVARAIRAANP